MHISLVIPTFSRAELLPKTLPRLAQQVTCGIDYEVVLVNNGSPDNTADVISAAMQRYPDRFQYFHIPPSGGPSRPRNIGIRKARGEVVVIVDDDVVPHPDFVQRHWEFHQRNPEPQAAALGEVYVPDELKRDPMSLFHDFPYAEARRMAELNYLFFWTCNVSVKRDFMLKHGMFPEDMLYYEDIVCGQRLAANGMQLRLLPEARGEHMHKLNPGGVPKKGRLTGRWLFTLTQRIPDLAIKQRFGIITPEIGMRLLISRLLRRAAFRATDNGLTSSLLRLMGAERSRRSSITDLYYYLIFRRNMLAGYYEAKAEWEEKQGAGVALQQRVS